METILIQSWLSLNLVFMEFMGFPPALLLATVRRLLSY